ncbi:MAG: hypothetical protein PHY02_11180 [Phycisphaerae bacterium]|nr:hypothetical protein [Phycisphaerae bacterium]
MDDQIKVIVRTEIREALSDFSKAESAAKKSAASMDNSFKKVGNSIKNAVGAMVGVAAVTKVLKDSVVAFMDSEKASNNLFQAFTKTSDKAGELTDKFVAFAAEQQRLTAFEDDAIVTNGALMQSLTQLSEKGLEEGMAAAMDLAAAKGIELSAATEMVSKAIAVDTSILRRQGIALEDGATKEERLAIVTKGLNAQFGGAAAAQLDTYAGKIAQLNNRIGDLQEQIGEGVLQGLFAKKGEDPIGQFLDSLEQGGAGLRSFVRTAVALVSAIGGSVITIIQTVAGAIGTTIAIAADAISSLGERSFSEIGDRIKAQLDASDKEIESKWKATGALWANIATEPEKIVRRERKETNRQTETMDRDMLAKRLKILNEWRALSKDGMQKELADLKTKYDEDIKKAELNGKDRAEITKSYGNAQSTIYKKYIDEYTKNEKEAAIKLENEKYKIAQDALRERMLLNAAAAQGNQSELQLLADNYEKDSAELTAIHATAIETISNQTTAAEQKAMEVGVAAFDAISKAIDGSDKSLQTFGDQMRQTASNIAASKNWIELLARGIVDSITYIVNEFKKAGVAREMEEQITADNIKNIETQILQNQLDNLTVLQNAQTKQLQDRQKSEMDLFMNSSAAGQAYNAMKAQEEADRVAGMDATERAKYDIQVKYEAEKKALEDKQAAEAKKLADDQKAERNRIKGQQFELEKRIAKDEAWIKVNQAFADVHSKFPMPWDEPTRSKLFGLLQDTYDRTVGAINSRVFIPEFALGGRPPVGQMSMVGERGPELFVPDRAGTIIPNNRISNTTQNMGQTFQISSLNLNGVQDVQGLAKALQSMANGMGKTLFA